MSEVKRLVSISGDYTVVTTEEIDIIEVAGQSVPLTVTLPVLSTVP